VVFIIIFQLRHRKEVRLLADVSKQELDEVDSLKKKNVEVKQLPLNFKTNWPSGPFAALITLEFCFVGIYTLSGRGSFIVPPAYKWNITKRLVLA